MPSIGKTYETALVTIPPEDVWEPIQAIRRVHDSKIRRWMPHVTLIYPFCPKTEFTSVASEVTSACTKRHPVEVTLSSFETFDHGKGHFTIWLKPEPTEPLLDLHAAIWWPIAERMLAIVILSAVLCAAMWQILRVVDRRLQPTRRNGDH